MFIAREQGPTVGVERTVHRGNRARITRPRHTTHRTRLRFDGAGRGERYRGVFVIGRDDRCASGPARRPFNEPLRADSLYRVVRVRRIRQPVGAVHTVPGPIGQQPEARLHVAVPGHQRFDRARRQGGTHVRQHQVALHKEHRLVVPDQRPVAVLRAQLWVRGSHDGRRTLAGAHQTVFLQKGAFLQCLLVAAAAARSLNSRVRGVQTVASRLSREPKS